MSIEKKKLGPNIKVTVGIHTFPLVFKGINPLIVNNTKSSKIILDPHYASCKKNCCRKK
jgi:hypothetical protein